MQPDSRAICICLSAIRQPTPNRSFPRTARPRRRLSSSSYRLTRQPKSLASGSWTRWTRNPKALLSRQHRQHRQPEISWLPMGYRQYQSTAIVRRGGCGLPQSRSSRCASPVRPIRQCQYQANASDGSLNQWSECGQHQHSLRVWLARALQKQRTVGH